MTLSRLPRLLLTAALATVPLVGAVILPATPALAATPLPAPTQLQVVHISDTSADFWWTRDPSSGNDVVERKVNGVWREYARDLFGVLALTNLTPGTTYTFRVYSIPYQYSGYTTSPRSAPISFTTLSGPDTVPPTAPPKPLINSITTSGATVYWGEATDNVQVTGYHLQQLIGGVWTTIRTVGAGARFQNVGGLSPSTSYSFAAIAFDARGNTSPRGEAATFTTLAATAYPTCRVQIIAYNPGFQVTVTIINTTPVATNGWTIAFNLASHVTVGTAFSGTLTRTGNTATITPLVWSAVIGPGGQLFTGFSGNSPAPFSPPSGFTLNGQPCTTV